MKGIAKTKAVSRDGRVFWGSINFVRSEWYVNVNIPKGYKKIRLTYLKEKTFNQKLTNLANTKKVAIFIYTK